MTGGEIWKIAEEMARRGWRVSTASVMAEWRRGGFGVKAFGSLFPAHKKPPALVLHLEMVPRAPSSRAQIRRSAGYRSRRAALGARWREQEARFTKPGRAVLILISRGPLRRSRILGELAAAHRVLGGHALDWPSVEGSGLASICHTVAASDGPWKIASMTWSRGARPHASIGLHESGRFWVIIFFWPPPKSRAFDGVTRALERAGYVRASSEPPPGPNIHFNLMPVRFSPARLRRELARLERLTAPRREARAGS